MQHQIKPLLRHQQQIPATFKIHNPLHVKLHIDYVKTRTLWCILRMGALYFPKRASCESFSYILYISENPRGSWLPQCRVRRPREASSCWPSIEHSTHLAGVSNFLRWCTAWMLTLHLPAPTAQRQYSVLRRCLTLDPSTMNKNTGGLLKELINFQVIRLQLASYTQLLQN